MVIQIYWRKPLIFILNLTLLDRENIGQNYIYHSVARLRHIEIY